MHLLYNELGGRTVPSLLVEYKGEKYRFCCATREERADVTFAAEKYGWDCTPLYFEVLGTKYCVKIGTVVQTFDSRKEASKYIAIMKSSGYSHLKVINGLPTNEAGIFCYPMPEKHKVLEPKFSTVTARNDKGRVTSVYRRRN